MDSGPQADSTSEPVTEAKQFPGTPYMTVSLSAPTNRLPLGETLKVTIKLTYNGVVNDAGDPETNPARAKPIIFHNTIGRLIDFELERRPRDYDPKKEPQEPEWGRGNYDGCTSRMIEGENYEVKVADDEDFASLQVGESWSCVVGLDHHGMHEDTAVGDRFRFVYWGGGLDWWDWGSREEHAARGTVVTFPPWKGFVIEPPANDGRPVILLPECGAVEFLIV